MDVEFLKYGYEDGYDGVITQTKLKVGVRHIQVLYMFLCSLVMGAARGAVGIQLLTLGDPHRRNDTYIQIHEWDGTIQGTLSSAFFFGYALMLIPAELYLGRLGDKLMMTAVLLVNGGLSAAMPTIVNKGGWVATCNALFLLGMSQACFTPMNHSMLIKWLPPVERRMLGCFVDGGTILGIVTALPVLGILSETRLGWELLFYSQAIIAFSMSAMWGLLTAGSPDEHQAVGDSEKEYIKEASRCYRKRFLRRPWRRIMRSREMWAVACAHAASNSLFIFYIVAVPVYLQSQGSSLRTCSQRTALAFVAMWLVHTTTAPTISWINNSSLITFLFNVSYLRKIINTLGAFTIVVGLIFVPQIASSSTHMGLLVLIAILGLLGLQFSGFLENIRDITQNYSRTVMFVSSAIASAVGAFVPFVCGLILGDDTTDPGRWRVVFLTLGSFYAVCNVVYMMLVSGQRQPWDDDVGNKFVYHNAMVSLDGANQLELEDMRQEKELK